MSSTEPIVPASSPEKPVADLACEPIRSALGHPLALLQQIPAADSVPPQLRDRLTPGRNVDANAESALTFACGVLDILGLTIAALVRRGAIRPDALADDLRAHADFWRARGRDSQAAPSEVLLEVLDAAVRKAAAARLAEALAAGAGVH